MDAEFADAGFDLGHAGLVGKGGVGVGFGVEGLGGVEAGTEASGDGGRGAEVAVDVEEFFSLGVEGFKVGVGDGPGGGDAALVMNDAEVLGAHAEHRGAVDLGLAADEVGLLGVEVLAVLVVPGFAGVVAVVQEDGGGGPVELLLGQEGSALEDENALAGPGKAEGKGAAAGSGTDDDRVVGVRHVALDAGIGLVSCEKSWTQRT